MLAEDQILLHFAELDALVQIDGTNEENDECISETKHLELIGHCNDQLECGQTHANGGNYNAKNET